MNKQLTTRARLVLSFGIVLGLMLLVAGIAIWQLASVAEATRNLTETPLTKERLITDWHSNINAAVNRTTAIAKSNDPSLMAYFETISEQSAKHSKELQEEIGKLLASDEEKKLFAEILKSSAVYASSSKEIYEHRTEGRLFQARQVFEQQYLPGS
ncbi:MAG: hypothetical protein K0S28_570, partial [Paucimonas sp.]|nr:hypothetical protein [Paucimonas sp.]